MDLKNPPTFCFLTHYLYLKISLISVPFHTIIVAGYMVSNPHHWVENHWALNPFMYKARHTGFLYTRRLLCNCRHTDCCETMLWCFYVIWHVQHSNILFKEHFSPKWFEWLLNYRTKANIALSYEEIIWPILFYFKSSLKWLVYESKYKKKKNS